MGTWCNCLHVGCRYLIDAGADIAAVNSDGDLASDLAEGQDMEDLIKEEMAKQSM